MNIKDLTATLRGPAGSSHAGVAGGDAARRVAMQPNAPRRDERGRSDTTAPRSVAHVPDHLAVSGRRPGVASQTLHTDGAMQIRRLGLERHCWALLGTEPCDRLVLLLHGTARINGQVAKKGDLVALPYQPGRAHRVAANTTEAQAIIIDRPPGSLAMASAQMVREGSLRHQPMREEGIDVLELFRDPGGSVSVAKVRLRAGATSTRHQLTVQENYIVTQGTGRMHLVAAQQDLDGAPRHTQRTVGPIEVVHIPAGTDQWMQAHHREVTFYCICTPAFTMDCFRDTSHRRD